MFSNKIEQNLRLKYNAKVCLCANDTKGKEIRDSLKLIQIKFYSLKYLLRFILLTEIHRDNVNGSEI